MLTPTHTPQSESQEKHASDLDLEVGCIGTELGKYHGGYFANPSIAEVFPQTIDRDLWENDFPEEVRVLGLGVGPALVETLVARKLEEMNFRVRLILSDRLEEAMKEYYPEYAPEGNVEKKVFDNKAIDLPDESVDLVVMRSVLHYESIIPMQVKVLREVHRVLRMGGIFLDQDLTFSTEEEASLARLERRLVGKNTSYCEEGRFLDMHEKVFGYENVRCSGRQPAPFYTDGTDYLERFKVPTERQDEVIGEIQKYIEDNSDKLLNAALNGDTFFRRTTPFKLLICKKN